MKQVFVRRWFLMALLGVLLLGFGFCRDLAPQFEALGGGWRSYLVAAVMFAMAFPVDASSMWGALRRPAATLLAVAINFGLLPLMAWIVAGAAQPWLGRDLYFGLLIAGAVPSTVASAAVWTRRGGGNDAVSLMVTMITNVGCFIVTPWLLLLMAGARVEGGSLEPARMMAKLSLVVAAPVLAAQLLRLVRPLGNWATRKKTAWGVFCQLGMLAMVFAGAVRSGAAISGTDAKPLAVYAWSAMIGCVLLIHLTMLAAGHVLGKGLRLCRADRIAVGFSGSQKTLLVGLSIALDYREEFGPMALLPMVVYHVSQLLVDTFIADKLRATAGRSDASIENPPIMVDEASDDSLL